MLPTNRLGLVMLNCLSFPDHSRLSPVFCLPSLPSFFTMLAPTLFPEILPWTPGWVSIPSLNPVLCGHHHGIYHLVFKCFCLCVCISHWTESSSGDQHRKPLPSSSPLPLTQRPDVTSQKSHLPSPDTPPLGSPSFLLVTYHFVVFLVYLNVC